MPNTFTDNRDRWLQMSDVDYLGQFVKAWLAFNAWYRSAYAETQDRKIIDEIKWNPNQVASKFRPLLNRTSEEAEQFRTEIGLLHHRLENYELHHGKGDDKARIRFSKIIIRVEPPIFEELTYRNNQCTFERVQNGSVTVTVVDRNGASKVNLQQQRFDPAELEADASFQTLAPGLRKRCSRCYARVNPQLERDLTAGDEAGDEDVIQCGTHSFRCGPDFLFAGVVEVVYLMRCSLFHGELVPTRKASDCYEPAYRIVRRFLEAVT